MTVLIDNIIAPRVFELIRDKISEILAVEIANQFILTSDESINATVWLERYVPFDKVDLPAINVCLASGSYDDTSVVDQDGDFTYYIDVYTSAKTTNSQRGYLTSSLTCQRLTGIVQGILSDAKYKNLGFSEKIISNRTLREFSILEPQNTKDAISMVMARLTFNVRATDDEKLIEGITVGEALTTTKLNDSENGLYYEV